MSPTTIGLWMPCFLSCKSKSVLAKPLEHQSFEREFVHKTLSCIGGCLARIGSRCQENRARIYDERSLSGLAIDSHNVRQRQGLAEGS